MEDLHSKVQLSSEELRYVISNWMASAKEKLDLHLPNPGTQENGHEDPMRERVNELMDEFILETFELFKNSLIIDGSPINSAQSLKAHLNQPNNLIDPFDKELNEELKSIYQQVDAETLRISQLRREEPRGLAEAYRLIIEEEERNIYQRQSNVNDVVDDNNDNGEDLDILKKYESSTINEDSAAMKQLLNDITTTQWPKTKENLRRLEHSIEFLTPDQ